jgi:hypothetical protein
MHIKSFTKLDVLLVISFKNIVFDVTLSVYPHREGRKVNLTTVGIELRVISE